MAQCKSCGAEIIWCKTPTGRVMPIDAATEALWLVEDGSGGPTCRPVKVRKSHFATCPQADEHRRVRK